MKSKKKEVASCILCGCAGGAAFSYEGGWTMGCFCGHLRAVCPRCSRIHRPQLNTGKLSRPAPFLSTLLLHAATIDLSKKSKSQSHSCARCGRRLGDHSGLCRNEKACAVRSEKKASQDL